MWKVQQFLYIEWIFSPGIMWLSRLVVFHWTGRGGGSAIFPRNLVYFYIYILYQKNWSSWRDGDSLGGGGGVDLCCVSELGVKGSRAGEVFTETN